MEANTSELELHSLIVDKNDLALAKLYDLYSESIAEKLTRLYSDIARKDESLILEAINEAFFGYSKNPNTFDPKKNNLQRFLEIAAERDLINIITREKKHFKKQNLPQDVELKENYWNNIKKDSQSADANIIARQSLEIVDKELSTYFDNNTDVILARLILSGERDTEPFSEILRIQELSIDDQREEVKRNKDRIKKVLERNNVNSKLKNLLK